MKVFVGLAISALVGLAGVLAFAPRSMPALQPTQIPAERMQINGIEVTRMGWVMAGELGHILISRDQGRSWTAADVPSSRQALINRLVFADDTNGLALGHEGWILRTTDGGRSWKESAFRAEGGEPLLDAARLPSGDWLAVGAFGRVLRSRDGGRSWQNEAIPGLADWHLNGIAASKDRQRWLILGEAGTLLRSQDGGQSWQPVEPFYSGSLYGAVSLGGATWIAYGMRGHLFRSGDDGRSWSAVALPSTASLYAGTLLPDGRLLLAGQGGVVLASDDRGLSFQVLRETGQENLTDILVPSSGPWLLVSDAGLRRLERPGAEPHAPTTMPITSSHQGTP
ncbi:YCF48-related protein [Pseudomonas sp. BN411]|uniref:WD40/YVTN/BNR-like repeat-containing protein n=1 Tax=Pseudomonas sp. BN411 TaxID=2567887 RepID=UPI0024577DE6|nr:YCF48-related protein [Pseudomonas sp. BN411]MDH4564996.1 glycosyl hydrolase [Pseudomonas sp. BN411]